MLKLLSWFSNRIPFLGVVVLLIFIPLYPKFPLYEVPATYVAIRFEDFFVVFLVAFFVIKAILERNNILKDRLSQLVVLYFAVGAISSLSAIMITKNVIPHIVLLHWLRRIEYMSLLFVAVASVRSLRDVKDYLLVITLAAVGVIVYGIGQKFYGWPVVSTMNEEFSKGLLLSLTEWARVNSTFAGHYDLAAYLVLVLAISVAAIIGFPRLWQKIALAIFGVSAFYLLILTASQISVLAYLIGVSIAILLSRKYLWFIPIFLISFVGIATSDDLGRRYATTLKVNLDLMLGTYKTRGQRPVVLVPTATPTPIPVPAPVTTRIKPPPRKKIRIIPTPIPLPTPTPTVSLEKKYVYYPPLEPTGSAELTAYRSIKIRFNVEWPRAIKAFLKNPFLGTGYSSITLATDNDYLRALGETGFMGLVALGLIFVEIFRRFIRFLSLKKTGLERFIVIGIFSALVGFLINAVFIDVLESSKIAFVFWMLMGIMIGIMNISESAKVAKSK